MKKLIRDHRTIGVELGRSEVQVDGQRFPVIIYQTEPEGIPRSLFGNGWVEVDEADVKKYFVSQLFSVMTQAFFFDLPPDTVQEIANEALEKAERYVASQNSQNTLVPLQR